METNRFAFVVHPLDVSFIHRHPSFRWTRFLPDWFVEAVGAWVPPIYLSRIRGGESPTTGQRIEGYLYSLGATPGQMMRHSEGFVYSRLKLAAKMATRRGARIMGLGAFTSVIGDAGVSVASGVDIAITTGNSLTVATTMEAARQAVLQMGMGDLPGIQTMVIGATGSIGAVCSRLLAQEGSHLVLIAPEKDKLLALKQRILEETPGAYVCIATQADEWLSGCDLIIAATSAFDQRVLDITRCKPGAVICDVARPPDIREDDAALRPDVLVIESGDVIIPGEVQIGYDIGLPPNTVYACLAETALLAMEGRFEDYTLGRDISIERVREIFALFEKHQFKLAGLFSYARLITQDEILEKRALAERLRDDPRSLEQFRVEGGKRAVKSPGLSIGIHTPGRAGKIWLWAGVIGMTGLLALVFNRSRR